MLGKLVFIYFFFILFIFFDECSDGVFIRSFNFVNPFAAFEENKSGHTANSHFHTNFFQIRIVNVDFDNFNFAKFFVHFVQNWRNIFTWTAPVSEKIDQNQFVLKKQIWVRVKNLSGKIIDFWKKKIYDQKFFSKKKLNILSVLPGQ